MTDATKFTINALISLRECIENAQTKEEFDMYVNQAKGAIRLYYFMKDNPKFANKHISKELDELNAYIIFNNWSK